MFIVNTQSWFNGGHRSSRLALHLKNIALKLQVDCMKTQAGIALQHRKIKTVKNVVSYKAKC